jgi:hypothetical protein
MMMMTISSTTSVTARKNMRTQTDVNRTFFHGNLAKRIDGHFHILELDARLVGAYAHFDRIVC